MAKWPRLKAQKEGTINTRLESFGRRSTLLIDEIF